MAARCRPCRANFYHFLHAKNVCLRCETFFVTLTSQVSLSLYMSHHAGLLSRVLQIQNIAAYKRLKPLESYKVALDQKPHPKVEKLQISHGFYTRLEGICSCMQHLTSWNVEWMRKIFLRWKQTVERMQRWACNRPISSQPFSAGCHGNRNWRPIWKVAWWASVSCRRSRMYGIQCKVVQFCSVIPNSTAFFCRNLSHVGGNE